MPQNTVEHDLLRTTRHASRSRRGGFKTVELNHLGWGALIGLGLTLGAIVVVTSPLDAWFVLPAGVLITWTLLLVSDHFRWRNSMIGIGYGGMDAVIGAVIVDQLRDMGIAATYREETHEFDEEPLTQTSIVCRHADADVVRRLMDQHLR